MSSAVRPVISPQITFCLPASPSCTFVCVLRFCLSAEGKASGWDRVVISMFSYAMILNLSIRRSYEQANCGLQLAGSSCPHCSHDTDVSSPRGTSSRVPQSGQNNNEPVPRSSQFSKLFITRSGSHRFFLRAACFEPRVSVVLQCADPLNQTTFGLSGSRQNKARRPQWRNEKSTRQNNCANQTRPRATFLFGPSAAVVQTGISAPPRFRARHPLAQRPCRSSGGQRLS